MVEHSISLAKYRFRKKDEADKREERGWKPISKAEAIPDENAQEQLIEAENRVFVEGLLPKLSERRGRVLKMIIYDELTLEQAANREDVSPERIRRIKHDAILDLKKIINSFAK